MSRHGSAGIQVLLGLALLLGLVAIVCYWLFASTPKDMLAVGSPTPAQIRKIATQLLVHDDIEIRAAAGARLAEVGQDAVPVLEEISLFHSDEYVRSVVLDSLMEIDTQVTVDVLEKLMVDPSVEARRTAAATAVRLKHPRSRAILKKALDDEDSGVLLAGIEGCEVKRIHKAVPKLESALKHPNVTIRRHAARALRVLTGRSYRKKIRQ